MAIRIALSHRTRYVYAHPVGMTPQVIRLRPAPHTRTPIHSYSLRIEPAKHFLNWQQDAYGNFLARVVVPEKTPVFSVTVDLVADLETVQPVRFLPRTVRRKVPVLVYRAGTARACAVSRDRESFSRAPGVHREVRSLEPADGRLSGRYQPAGVPGHRVHHPARARRADPRRDARARARLVPRFELALGASAAAAGHRGAVRLGLPGAALRRSEAGRRPRRARQRLHRSARVVRSVRARRGLDRPRSHFGASRCRRAHSARVRARATRPRRRSKGQPTTSTPTFNSTCRSQRDRRRRRG